VEGQELPKITRQSELNDNILRSLLLKVDPRIVDALVAHATGAVAKPAPEKAEGAAPEAASGEEVANVVAGADEAAPE
jgi:hypothetical protein